MSKLPIHLSGSPLRVQEHFCVCSSQTVSIRITPACAGTFSYKRLGRSYRRDHPCVCRNIHTYLDSFFHRMGSPLRVQEHYSENNHQIFLNRITPACAGTLSAYQKRFFYIGDHPCVCRNIKRLTLKRHFYLGSPLRVQEHLAINHQNHKRQRITPACAGTFNED